MIFWRKNCKMREVFFFFRGAGGGGKRVSREKGCFFNSTKNVA